MPLTSFWSIIHNELMLTPGELQLTRENLERYFGLLPQVEQNPESAAALHQDLISVLLISVVARCKPRALVTALSSFSAKTTISDINNHFELSAFGLQLDPSRFSLSSPEDTRLQKIADAKRELASIVSDEAKKAKAVTRHPISESHLLSQEAAHVLSALAARHNCSIMSMKTVAEFSRDHETRRKLFENCFSHMKGFEKNTMRELKSLYNLLAQNGSAPQIHEQLSCLDESDEAKVRRAAGLTGEASNDVKKLIKIIMIGNSGVGKSRSGNLLLGRSDLFESQCQAGSVTEFASAALVSHSDLGGQMALFIDTPGLIESDEERIEHNRKEIVRAIKFLPNVPTAIIIFFNGADRISHSDMELVVALRGIITFRAAEGVSLIINNFPTSKTPEEELSLQYEFASYAERCIGIKFIPSFIPHCSVPAHLEDPTSNAAINARANIFLAVQNALKTAQVITLGPNAELKLERHTLMEEIKNDEIKNNEQADSIKNKGTVDRGEFEKRMQSHKRDLDAANKKMRGGGCGGGGGCIVQ